MSGYSNACAIPYSRFGEDVLPLLFCRSGLFTTATLGSGTYVKDRLVGSFRPWTIYYTGELLNQRDLDVWLACLRVALRRQEQSGTPIAGEPVRTSRAELLAELGLSYCGKSARTLTEHLLRFRNAMLVIDGPIRVETALLLRDLSAEKGEDGLSFEFDPLLMPLLANHLAKVAFIQARGLRDKLAKWIFRYASTCGKNLVAVGVENIRRVTGNAEPIVFYNQKTREDVIVREAVPLFEFRRTLSQACDKALAAAEPGTFAQLEMDASRGDHGQLLVRRVSDAPVLIAKTASVPSPQAVAARERRGRVAL